MLNRMLGLNVTSKAAGSFSVHKEEHAGRGMQSEEVFLRSLCVERKRTERSGRRFILLLVEAGDFLRRVTATEGARLVEAIVQCTRDTDIAGWYKDRETLGVIFTEIGEAEDDSIVQALSSRLSDALYGVLDEISEVKLSFHVFPEDWDEDGGHSAPVKATLQLVMAREVNHKRLSFGLKRLMDIAGSLAGLLVCLPLFAVIGLAIKLTSKGPIFFRQARLGQYGRKFTFLKFRSMYANNDPKIHEEFVKSLIQGSADIEQTDGNNQKVYKLTTDPRITRVGRILRNTSLDELPQFLNVLRGDMSLVGPRPPVIYEYKTYSLWHRQRLLAVRPGITGLWQVEGRSRVKFDDMVRMDIRYARSWSLWLDVKILLRTPSAVVSGNGAC